nr:unnamed protein product [Trichobilharzia regenti]
MKEFMDFEPLLQRLPFNFAPMTTASDFSHVKLEQLLSHLGVFQQGLWKYEFCPQFCQISPDPFCIPKILINRKLIIHLIGVEKELSLLPIFKELDYLFKSQLRIHIYFIGQHFDATADKTVYHLSSRLSISVWSGLYHEFLYARKMTGETPDLIVGFNAGLAAYSTWPASLSAIAEMGVPAFFTDSCLYSSLWGFQVTSSLGLGPSQPDSIVGDDYKPGNVENQSCITMNPFRSPIRIEAPGVRWGWFSNAFIFSPFYPMDYLRQRSDLPLRMASMNV